MLKTTLGKLKSISQKYGFKGLLPLLYLLGLAVSLILTVLSYIFPFLIVWSSGFISLGIPLGWITALFLSWPGYFGFGIIEKILFQNPETILLIIGIFLISIAAYYLIGLMIDLTITVFKNKLTKN